MAFDPLQVVQKHAQIAASSSQQVTIVSRIFTGGERQATAHLVVRHVTAGGGGLVAGTALCRLDVGQNPVLRRLAQPRPMRMLIPRLMHRLREQEPL